GGYKRYEDLTRDDALLEFSDLVFDILRYLTVKVVVRSQACAAVRQVEGIVFALEFARLDVREHSFQRQERVPHIACYDYIRSKGIHIHKTPDHVRLFRLLCGFDHSKTRPAGTDVDVISALVHLGFGSFVTERGIKPGIGKCLQ